MTKSRYESLRTSTATFLFLAAPGTAASKVLWMLVPTSSPELLGRFLVARWVVPSDVEATVDFVLDALLVDGMVAGETSSTEPPESCADVRLVVIRNVTATTDRC
jgi:hypothetical protein